MNGKKLLSFIAMCFLSLHTFAAESVAKEETTPPSAEGPIPADQIPPIMNLGKTAPAAQHNQAPAVSMNAPTDISIPINPPTQ